MRSPNVKPVLLTKEQIDALHQLQEKERSNSLLVSPPAFMKLPAD